MNQDPSRYRVVLDTNQIVGAGSRWLTHRPAKPNVAQRIIQAVAERHIGLISSKIAAEYVEKLMDCGHPSDRIVTYVGYILGAFERVSVVSVTCPFPPSDFDDVIFLLCAIDGKAHMLVTDDRHLLDLQTSYASPQILNGSDAIGPLGA